MVTRVDRKSTETILQDVRHKMIGAVGTAVHCGLVPYKALVQIITDDNGHDCAAHAGIATDLEDSRTGGGSFESITVL